ncbi:MAG: hypothetical protein H7X79_05020 [Sporomusaceae bacterium]|nr:hypothetical protein [Sporomusaceae bacterium]
MNLNYGVWHQFNGLRFNPVFRNDSGGFGHGLGGFGHGFGGFGHGFACYCPIFVIGLGDYDDDDWIDTKFIA